MRIVVKIGTSTLTHATGHLNIRRVAQLCQVISDIKNAGHEVILVSSGAIGMGVGKLSLKGRPKDMPGKQAAAAVGQRVLQAGLLDGFDMLHSCNPPFLKKGYMGIIHDSGSNCNHFPEIFDTIAPIIPPVAVPMARSAKYAVHGAP